MNLFRRIFSRSSTPSVRRHSLALEPLEPRILLGGVYVSVDDENAADLPGHGSMDLPYASIQYALDYTSGTESDPVDIHVAAGTYMGRIILDDNDQYTNILGGYNPNDWSDRVYQTPEDRENPTYQTLITGDVNSDGVADYRCVYFDGDAQVGTLSGLYITRGYAERGGGIHVEPWYDLQIRYCTISENSASESGGGIYNNGTLNVTDSAMSGNYAGGGVYTGYGGAIFSNYYLKVDRCTVAGNRAAYWGGGICDRGLELTIQHTRIIDNVSAGSGGGIWSDGSTVYISSCDVTGNSAATEGGGMYNNSASEVVSCIISGNSAGTDGGGVLNLNCRLDVSFSAIRANSASEDGGGISNCGCGTLNVTSSLIAANSAAADGGGIRNDFKAMVASSIITSNQAQRGGAISNSWSLLSLACSTLTDNSASAAGGIYNAESGRLDVSNSILWGNGTELEIQADDTVTYSDVQGGWFGVGNIDADPLFADAQNADFHLQASSYCVDMGNNDLVPEWLTEDLDGNPRIVNGKPEIPGPHVDMGAYEYQPPPPEITLLGLSGLSITDNDTTPSTMDGTDFGSVRQYGPGRTCAFTVRNDGGQTLTLGSVSLPTGFSLTEGLSSSLPAGESDTFTVRLDTATLGTKTGQISFPNNDSDENPFNFSVMGTVTPEATPEITVLGVSGFLVTDNDTTPSTTDGTDFGSVQEGQPGPTRTFTVRNDGDATLTLGPVSAPTGFSLTEGLSSSLGAAESDTFTVRLDTATLGTKSGQISFPNNDSDENPFNFSVTGTVTEVPNTPPTLNLLLPSEDLTVTRGQDVTIAWTDSDPDDNADILLAYDRDDNSTPWSNDDHTWIIAGLPEDPDMSGDVWFWSSGSVEPGTYTIWGVIFDGTNEPVYSRALGRVTIQPTIFDVVDFDTGTGQEVKTFITGLLGDPDDVGLWDTFVSAMDDPIECFTNMTVGFKFGAEASLSVGQGVYVDVASVGWGMSVGYSFSDDYWTIARAWELDFLSASLAGDEYLTVPGEMDGRPIGAGVGLVGEYSIAGGSTEVKAGIRKGIEATVGIGGGLGVDLSVSVETYLSEQEFLHLTEQDSIGMGVLDSFGLAWSGWGELIQDTLGSLTGFGRPILSLLGASDDPLGLLVQGDADIDVGVTAGTSADLSLKVNLGAATPTPVAQVSAGVYAAVFARADLGVVTLWQQTFPRSALSGDDDVGNSAATATNLTPWTNYQRQLDRYDRDFFAFDSARNQEHQFVIAPGEAHQFAVVIRDTDQSVLKRITASTSDYVTVPFTAQDGGQYFLSVEGTRYTSSGTYFVQWHPGHADGTFGSGLVGYDHAGSVFLVDQGAGDYAAHLREQSAASLSTEISAPEIDPELTFEYRLVSAGDGDLMEIRIDGTLIWWVPIDSTQIDFVTAGPIDLSDYAGQTINVEFYLNSVGNPNAAFEIDNVVVEGSEVHTFYSPYGRATVSLYDVLGERDVDPADVIVNFSRNGAVPGILLGGTQPMEGLGIVISGASSVGRIIDARRGSLGDIAFVASDAPIGSVYLRSGVSGFDLNGLTLGGLDFGNDVDGDTDLSDLTGVYTARYLGSLVAMGNVGGDVVVGGNLNVLQVIGGSLDGDVVLTASNLGTVLARSLYGAGGGIGGDIYASGNIGAVLAIGGDATGSIEAASGYIGRVLAQALYHPYGSGWVGGSISGDITAGQWIGSVQAIRGSAGVDSTIQAGGWINLVRSVGGDIAGSITATSGHIGRVLAQAIWTGSGWQGGAIGADVAAGGYVASVVSVNGSGIDADVTAGSWVGSVVSVGGDVQGTVTALDGHVGSVLAKAAWNGLSWSGGSMDVDVSATGHVGSVISVNGAGMACGVTSGSWIGQVTSIGSDLDLTGRQISAPDWIGLVRSINGGIIGDSDDATWEVEVANGNLAAVQAINGAITGVSVHVAGAGPYLGNIGSVVSRGAGAGITQSLLAAESRLTLVQAWGLWDPVERQYQGDLYNTSVRAGALGRILVGGHIYEDDTDGDPDEIHARTGRFFARDETWAGWIPADHWFDEGEPDGVRAWVG